MSSTAGDLLAPAQLTCSQKSLLVKNDSFRHRESQKRDRMRNLGANSVELDKGIGFVKTKREDYTQSDFCRWATAGSNEPDCIPWWPSTSTLIAFRATPTQSPISPLITGKTVPPTIALFKTPEPLRVRNPNAIRGGCPWYCPPTELHFLQGCRRLPFARQQSCCERTLFATVRAAHPRST